MTEQLDYIFFFYGLGFILFASVCLVLGKNKQHSLPWTWLGLFGLVHGMNEWLDMLALSIGDSNPFKALRICIMAASFLCLVEFGRLGTKSITGKGSTKLAILALFVIGCTGWLFGWTGLNVFFRYSLGLVGGLWSARAFFLASRNSKKRNEIHILLALYAIFVTYSIASGLITPKAPFFPASLLNQDSFLQLFGFPVQLLRGMLAVASAVCVWQMLQSHRQFAKRLYVFVFTVSALGIIMGGWFSVNHTGESTRRNSLESLHSTCRLLAAFVDPKIAEDFSLINKAGSPTEVRMRARFIAMLKNNKQYRWI